jgi:hypothetical protein
VERIEICKVKVKVKLTEHHDLKAYWGVEVYLHHAFFDLGTRWR